MCVSVSVCTLVQTKTSLQIWSVLVCINSHYLTIFKSVGKLVAQKTKNINNK